MIYEFQKTITQNTLLKETSGLVEKGYTYFTFVVENVKDEWIEIEPLNANINSIFEVNLSKGNTGKLSINILTTYLDTDFINSFPMIFNLVNDCVLDIKLYVNGTLNDNTHLELAGKYNIITTISWDNLKDKKFEGVINNEPSTDWQTKINKAIAPFNDDFSNINNQITTINNQVTTINTNIALKENKITAGTNTQYFRGDKTFQTLDKTAVGLANVDNTSDLNKPISTATQAALALKENIITAGTITQYFRGDKTFQTFDKIAVGLGNANNTSDLNKPISTATQAALDSVNASILPTQMFSPSRGEYLRYNGTKWVNYTNGGVSQTTINNAMSLTVGSITITTSAGALPQGISLSSKSGIGMLSNCALTGTLISSLGTQMIFNAPFSVSGTAVVLLTTIKLTVSSMMNLDLYLVNQLLIPEFYEIKFLSTSNSILILSVFQKY
jgi:hypothetical protein